VAWVTVERVTFADRGGAEPFEQPASTTPARRAAAAPLARSLSRCPVGRGLIGRGLIGRER
jgi:hypothetical protein